MVKKDKGEYTVNVAEMDEVIRKAWRPINLCYEHRPEPSVDIFMQQYRRHIRSVPIKVRVLNWQVLRNLAQKMGEKTANGMELWSIKLLKRLPGPFWDKLAELLPWWRRQGPGRPGWQRALPHWSPRGEGDPMKLRPLMVLSQIYRIWAGVRMEDAVEWQEGWAQEASYAFRPQRSSLDAAAVLTRLIELSHAVRGPLVGAGSDYTKCFDLVPQAISIAMLDI